MLVHILLGNARTFPIFISESDYHGLEDLFYFWAIFCRIHTDDFCLPNVGYYEKKWA